MQGPEKNWVFFYRKNMIFLNVPGNTSKGLRYIQRIYIAENKKLKICPNVVVLMIKIQKFKNSNKKKLLIKIKKL